MGPAAYTSDSAVSSPIPIIIGSLGLVISNQSADAEDFSSEETRLLQSQDGHRLSKKVKSKTKVVKF